MRFRHPIWLAGFRPFFALAFVSAFILPLLWVGFFTGIAVRDFSPLTPVQWHAHEMLFGFGWAVLGGFLLTASKNWVSVRGIHGATLAIAAALWCAERITIFYFGECPVALRFFLLNACVVWVIGYIQWTLIRFRNQDSFRDNYIFIVALPLLLVAKNLMLTPSFADGWGMAIGLFRVAFVVMFERTLPQFMKNAMAIQLPRYTLLDWPIKGLSLAAVFAGLLPNQVAAGLLAALACLLLARFALWSPLRALRNFGIGLSYFGYLGLVAHLIYESGRLFGWFGPVGSLGAHIFTFLCMGFVIPAMFIRICQGHTGRKLRFTASDRVAFAFMLAAAFFRLIATQAWPGAYSRWISFAGMGWAVCFALIGARLIPFLFQPRIDGREH